MTQSIFLCKKIVVFLKPFPSILLVTIFSNRRHHNAMKEKIQTGKLLLLMFSQRVLSYNCNFSQIFVSAIVSGSKVKEI